MLYLYIHLHSLHPWIILRLLVPFWLGLVLYIHSWDFWCCSTHLGDPVTEGPAQWLSLSLPASGPIPSLGEPVITESSSLQQCRLHTGLSFFGGSSMCTHSQAPHKCTSDKSSHRHTSGGMVVGLG